MSRQNASPTESASLVAPFVVRPRLDGDTLSIAISGELDIATVHLVQEAQRSEHDGYGFVRYELAGLGFMDSAGLRVLLAPAGSRIPIEQISITDPAPIVRRLLEISGVQGMIS